MADEKTINKLNLDLNNSDGKVTIDVINNITTSNYNSYRTKFITSNEGLELKTYIDTAPEGYKTVGYGFNMDRGVDKKASIDEWNAIFKNVNGAPKFQDVYDGTVELKKEYADILFDKAIETRIKEIEKDYVDIWNKLSPNEQLAIEDAYYQGPELVKKGGDFYNNIKKYTELKDQNPEEAQKYLEAAADELATRSNKSLDNGISNRNLKRASLLLDDENYTLPASEVRDLVDKIKANGNIPNIVMDGTSYSDYDTHDGGYGTITELKNADGTSSYIIPTEEQNGVKVVTIDQKTGEVLRDDYNTSESTYITDPNDGSISQIGEMVPITEEEKKIAKFLSEQENVVEQGEGDSLVDSGQIVTDGDTNSNTTPPKTTYDPESQTLTYTDTNGKQQQITYNEGNDLLIYGDPSNPDKITFTDPVTGAYQEWAPDENGEYQETTPIYETQTDVDIIGENPNIDTDTTTEPDNNEISEEELDEAIQQDEGNRQSSDEEDEASDEDILDGIDTEGMVETVPVDKVVIDFDETPEGEYTIQVVDEDGSISTYYGSSTDGSVLKLQGDDPSRPNRISFTDNNGDTTEWQRDSDGEYYEDTGYRTTISVNALSTVSSLVKANQDLTNIESITWDVTTDMVMESIKEGTIDGISSQDLINSVSSSVFVFAVSSYFEKNDSLSEVLGIDGTLLGNATDALVTTFSIQTLTATFTAMTKGVEFSSALTTAANSFDVYKALDNIAISLVLNELGYESQAHAILTNSSITISSIMGYDFASTLIIALGTYVFGSFFKSHPKAHALYEYDDEIQEYIQIKLASKNGGSPEAVDDIAQFIIEQLDLFTQNVGGVPLKNEDYMPDLSVFQKDDYVEINGEWSPLDDPSDNINALVLDHLNEYQVEGGSIHMKRAIYNYEGDDLEEILRIAQSSMNYQSYTFLSDDAKEVIDNLFQDGQLVLEAQIKLDDYFSQTDMILDELIAQREATIESFYVSYYRGDNDEEYKDIAWDKRDEAEALQKEIETLQELSHSNTLFTIETFQEALGEDNPLKLELEQIKTFNESYENLEEVKAILKWKTTFEDLREYNLDTPVPTEDQTKVEYQAEQFNTRLEYQIEIDKDEIKEIKLWKEKDNLVLKTIQETYVIPLDMMDEYTISVDGYAYSLESMISQAEAETIIVYGDDSDKEKTITFEQSLPLQPLTLDTEYFTPENSDHEVYQEPIHLDEKTLTNLTLELQGDMLTFTFEEGSFDVRVPEPNVLTLNIGIHSYSLQTVMEENGVVDGGGAVDIGALYFENIDEEFKELLEDAKEDIQEDTDTPHLTSLNEDEENFSLDGITVGTSTNDTIIATGDQSVIVDGGSGNDLLQGSIQDDILYGGDGTDFLYGAEGDDTLAGGSEDDYLDGGSGDDTLFGGAGDDIFVDIQGENHLDGGEGENDLLTLKEATQGVTVDLEEGYAHDETIQEDGSTSKNFYNDLINIEDVNGSYFDDTITGDAKDNEIKGLDGDDTIYASLGDDLYDGGEGYDSVDYGNLDSGIKAEISQEEIILSHTIEDEEQNEFTSNHTLTNIEQIDGTDYNDTFTINSDISISSKEGDDTVIINNGNSTITTGKGDDTVEIYGGENTLSTNEGSDRVEIHEGRNTIHLGDGNDTITLLGGENTIDGGDGSDTLNLSELTSGVNVDLSNGTVVTHSEDQNTNHTISNIENIVTTQYDDTIIGDKNNRFITADGDDKVSLKEGNNSVNLGSGDDLAITQDGRSYIQGESGDDTVISKSGDTTFNGGSGSDLFYGGSGSDTAIYSKDISEYTISSYQNNYIIVEDKNGNKDVLKDVDIIQFGNKKYKKENNSLKRIPFSNIDHSYYHETIRLSTYRDTTFSNQTYGSGESNTMAAAVATAVMYGATVAPNTLEASDDDLLSYLTQAPQTQNLTDYEKMVYKYKEDDTLVETTQEENSPQTPVQTTSLQETTTTISTKVINPTQIEIELTTINPNDPNTTSIDHIIYTPSTGINLVGAIEQYDGVWLVEDTTTLTMIIDEEYLEDISIRVDTILTDTQTQQTLIESKNIDEDMDTIALAPTLKVRSASTDEDRAIILDIDANLVDTDGSESLYFLIHDVPNGAALNHGIKQSDGSWKIEQKDISELYITPSPNSDEDFILKIEAVSQESRTGQTSSTFASLKVSVNSVVDMVSLNTADASGLEDHSIALFIQEQISDTDGSEDLIIYIKDLPLGATLNNGVYESTTNTWILDHSDLDGLALTPASNSDEDFTITIEAITREQKNSDSAIFSTTLDITVDGEADNAILIVDDAFSQEDTQIPLSIEATLSDTDGSETLYIVIHDIPEGAVLSAGILQEDNSYLLSLEELEGLTITPQPNSDEDFTLNIEAVSKESSSQSTISTFSTLDVSISSILDPFEFSVQNAEGLEDTAIPLVIQEKLFDTDGSETLTILIKDAPLGISLSNGEYDVVSNIWRLEQADLQNLTLTPPVNSDEDFTLTIEVIHLETKTQESTTLTTSIDITVYGIADAPALIVSDIKADEDTPITLDIRPTLKDTDGSEYIYLLIHDIPLGATLSQGVLQGDGSYRLEVDELQELILTPPLNSDEDFVLSIEAVTVDKESDTTSSTIKPLQVTLEGVSDTPSLNSIQKDATTLEDIAVSLSIDPLLSDTDGSEQLYILFHDFPQDTTFSQGSLQDDGTWRVEADLLETLFLYPAPNSDEDFTLKVEVVALDRESEIPSSIFDTIEVNITGVTDIPNIEVADSTTDEDIKVPLVINPELVDTDGSEHVYILIHDMPQGGTLNRGVYDSGTNQWRVEYDDIAELSLIPPLNSDVDFSLRVEIIAQDSESTLSQSTFDTINITLNPIGDAPILTPTHAVTDEDTEVVLEIETSLFDTDGSEELLYLQISNIPQDVVLSKGTLNLDGSYTLSIEELQDLRLIPPKDGDVDFTLQVELFSKEKGSETINSTLKPLFVTLQGVSDTPTLDIITQTLESDEDTAIEIVVDPQLSDTDGSESLYIIFDDFPQGTTFSQGSLQDDGRWRVDADKLEGLLLNPAPNSDEEFTLKVEAVALDRESNLPSSTFDTIEVDIKGITDEIFIQKDTLSLSEDLRASFDIGIFSEDIDGSEHVTLYIYDLPTGVTLSDGVYDDEKSAYKIEGYETIQNLSITPAADSDEDFTIRAEIFAQDRESDIITSDTKSIEVIVQGVSDAPILQTTDSATDEDISVALDIQTALSDADGSEELLYLLIHDVPNGAVLSHGVLQEEGVYRLEVDELENLYITPPYNSDEDFTLQVESFAQDRESDTPSSTIQALFVEVQGVSDTPILNSIDETLSSDEDIAAAINIDAALTDTDGSENLYVLFDQFPQGTTFSKGALGVDGKWRVEEEDLLGLQLIPAPQSDEEFTLSVEIVALDRETQITNSLFESIDVNIQGVTDIVAIGSDTLDLVEDIPIVFDLEFDIPDTDGSETTQLFIYDLPDGAVLSSGVYDNEKGAYKIEGYENIANLTITPPNDSDEDFTLDVELITKDRESEIVNSVRKSIEVNVDSRADTPTLGSHNLLLLQNSSIPFTIDSALNDIDGSETLEILVKNLPSTTSLSNGYKDENNIWHLLKEELDGLQILDQSTSLLENTITTPIEVVAIVSEFKNGNTNEISLDLQLDVRPLIENISVQGVMGGNDVIVGNNSSETLSTGGGNDTVYGQGGNDSIFTDMASGAVESSFTLNSANTTKAVTIEGIPNGASILSNGKVLSIQDGTCSINDPENTQYISIIYPFKTNMEIKVTSTDINDNRLSFEKNFHIDYQSSQDRLYGQDGDDALYSGGGNDYLYGGTGNDYLNGSAGNDYLYGESGTDYLYGGSGNDYLNGGSGTDKLDGGSGDDTLIIDSDDFLLNNIIYNIYGGSGYDTAQLMTSSDNSYTYTFDMEATNIEEVHGGDGNETIIGTQEEDVAYGNGGYDTYAMGDGDDTIYVDNNDLSNSVSIDGEEGYDYLIVQSDTGVTQTIENIDNIEHITLSSYNDTIMYDEGMEYINGGAGTNTLDFTNLEGVDANIYYSRIYFSNSDSISTYNIDRFIDSKGDDSFEGSFTSDIFVYKNGGNDYFNGNGGTDTLELSGVTYADISNQLSVDDLSQISQLNINGNRVNFTSIEKLQLSDHNIYIDGTNNTPIKTSSHNTSFILEEDNTSIFSASSLINQFYDFDNDDLSLEIESLDESNLTYALYQDHLFLRGTEDVNTTGGEYDFGARESSEVGFRYRVTDGESTSQWYTEYVTINAVDDASELVLQVDKTNYTVGEYGNPNDSFIVTLQDIDTASSMIDLVEVLPSFENNTTIERKFSYSISGINYVKFYGTYMGTTYIEDDLKYAEFDPIIGVINGDNITFREAYTREYDEVEPETLAAPIALDLNDDKEVLHKVEGENILFDVDLDGENEKLNAWINPEDGFLVYDQNGDQQIDQTEELVFTTWYDKAESEQDTTKDFNDDGVVDQSDFDSDQNGIITDMEGLKYFDTNGDNILDEKDQEWSKFGIWQDTNQNGITDDGEFVSLSDAGITQIDLTTTGSLQTIADGNAIIYGVSEVSGTEEDSLDAYDSALMYEEIEEDSSLVEEELLAYDTEPMEDQSSDWELDPTLLETLDQYEQEEEQLIEEVVVEDENKDQCEYEDEEVIENETFTETPTQIIEEEEHTLNETIEETQEDKDLTLTKQAIIINEQLAYDQGAKVDNTEQFVESSNNIEEETTIEEELIA